MTARVNATQLIDFATAVYAGAGVPAPDAHLIADTLVQADLWGHQSHGVLRLGWYLDHIRNGVMKPVTTSEFVVDAGAVAVIDGHDGVGHVLTELARNKQLPIPLGWAINSAGAPTTDPQEAIDGIILPMAKHKGYAIATMVDMLSGVLTGSGFLSNVHSPYKTAEKSNCGHLMVAMNIEAFTLSRSFTRAWMNS